MGTCFVFSALIPSLNLHKINYHFRDRKAQTNANMGDWSSGVFSCMDDVVICLLTCFVPCIPIAQMHADFDNRDTTIYDYLCGCCGTNIYLMRQSIRTREGFGNDELMDCLLTWC